MIPDSQAHLFPLIRHLHCVFAMVFTIVLTQCGLGPRDVRDPAHLARQFEKQFGFSPGPDVSDMQYRISESSDDFAEWFRFKADPATISKVRDSFTAGPKISSDASPSPTIPAWWQPDAFPAAEEHFGYRISRPGDSFSSQGVFLAYDAASRTALFKAASLR